MDNDPMQSAHAAPRCLARRKHDGQPCQAPAMQNGRCRLHGGKSTGPAPGSRNALKHGRYTAEAKEERLRTGALIKRLRADLGRFDA